MSYYALYESKELDAYVKREWEALMKKIDILRAGKKAKLMIGGPGVWEYMLMPEEIERHKIDYLFQGELDDVVCELVDQVTQGSIDNNMFSQSYVTYDDSFHRIVKQDSRFLSRGSAKGIPEHRGHTGHGQPEREGPYRGHEGLRHRLRLLRGNAQGA